MKLGARSSVGLGPPDVLAYDDYRAFLRDAFAWRKARERGFSHGVFARRAGLSSRSHLNLVLKGTVGLSPQAVEKYVEGFKLRGRQADYFRLLVRLNQARTPEERQASREAMRRWQAADQTPVLSQEDAEASVYDWAIFLVRALSRVYGFRADPRWISRRLEGRITPKEAARALRFLREKGILRISGKRLARSEPRFSVSLGPGAIPSRISFHDRLYREAAAQQAFPSTVTMVLTPAQAEELSQKYWEWILGNLPPHSDRGVPGEVCVMIHDIVPLSRRPS